MSNTNRDETKPELCIIREVYLGPIKQYTVASPTAK